MAIAWRMPSNLFTLCHMPRGSMSSAETLLQAGGGQDECRSSAAVARRMPSISSSHPCAFHMAWLNFVKWGLQAGGGQDKYRPSAAVARRMPSKWPRPVWHAPWKLYRVIAGHLG